MAANSDSQQPCYLLQLPRELRDVVYYYVYDRPHTSQEATVLDKIYARKATISPVDRGSLALLRTCKTLNQEATPIFEGNRVLYVSIKDSDIPYPGSFCVDEPLLPHDRDSLGRVKAEIEMSVWDTDPSTCHLLPGRVTALMEAINYGRGVKQLHVHFCVREYERDPGALCKAFKPLSYGGNITIEATARSQRILGPENLVELARSIGGTLSIGW
ncbi:hypothetical protein LTR08_001796 [Meristemomyces frigidus]|nr:hypothetical protein LTR08_001796 [Meristemomyces frigidus]